MKIAFLEKLSLIDYPGKIACIVFLVNCNFQCPWCYSSELVLPNKIKTLPLFKEQDFFSFLERRKNKLEAVVLCGGEPTLQPGLFLFCRKIKKMGFAVKIDTNGSNPHIIKNVLEQGLVDYVALDIKTSKENYNKAIGLDKQATLKILRQIDKTVALLKRSSIDFEFRTTCCPAFVGKNDILQIARWISPAKNYFLQTFRPEKTLNSLLTNVKPYSDEQMAGLLTLAQPFFTTCQIR